ncbi:MAG: hypothetical protein ABII21_00070 [bacterium]
MARNKTRAQKIQSEYRLQNFKIAAEERTQARDMSEFSYLSSEYVVKDLAKTFVYTVAILGLLVLAKNFLG